jgi:hypothetical protein
MGSGIRLEETIQSKIEVVKGRNGSRCTVT